MATKLKLSPELMERSEKFGIRMKRRYDLGLNEASRKLDILGGAKSVRVQMEARRGECACALRLGLDPMTVLDWNFEPDKGVDLIFRGCLNIDVKSTLPNSRLLQWFPTKKYSPKSFHVLVLVRGEGAYWEVVGWISKQAFFERKRISTGKPKDKLIAGSFFVDKDELWPMEDFDHRVPLAQLAIRARLVSEHVMGYWP